MLKTTEDTFEQKIARALDRHISLTANAGSGKTYVLVNRYLDTLLSKDIITPEKNYYRDTISDDVVAITFTRKAASEMLAKTIAKVEELTRNESSRDKREKLILIRQGLTQARVSTIHSFCSDIIRDFPVEAGINPSFYELESAEALEIMNIAIRSVLEDNLEEDSPNHEKLIELIKILGKNTLEQIISKIIQKIELPEKLQSFYSQPISEIIAFYNTQINQIISSTITEIKTFVGKLIDFIDTQQIPKRDINKISTAQEKLNNFHFDTNSDIQDLLEQFSEFQAHFFTKQHELRSPFSKFTQEISATNELQETKKNLEALSNFKKAFEFRDENTKLIEYATLITDLANQTKALIWDFKTELGAIDFNDIIEIANRILDNNHILKEVKSRIKYLLIDEFQDTDQTQYEIIKKLIPELNDPQKLFCGTNLFIVGDGKQSIYAFREADVRIFEQAKQDIQTANKYRIDQNDLTREIKIKDEIIPLNPNDDSYLGNMKLTTTFRLLPAISAFVNLVCGNIFSEKKSEYDVSYNNFICVRNAEKILNNQLDSTTTGTINFIFSYKPYKTTQTENTSPTDTNSNDNEENTSSADTNSNDNEENTEETQADSESDTITEAQSVTKVIKHIINSSEYLITEKDGTTRKPELNDIAILSRRNEAFLNLIQELQKEGVPYILHSGGSFYNSQEIIDIIGLFNFLNNYKDNVSLFALLRSPYFNIPDSELIKISLRKEASLWEKLISYTQENPSSIAPQRAVEILQELLDQIHQLSFAEIVLKTISDCDFFAYIKDNPNSKQIEANINKFLEIARNYEARGFKTISDFTNYLNFLREMSPLEPLAQFETTKGALNLLSIHSAKGLEFPIVILYNTNSKSGSRDNFFISKELGLAFTITKENETPNPLIVNTPILELLKHHKRQIDEAEEKRILYVATTRAKDHLFISSHFQVKKDGNFSSLYGLSNLIFKGLGVEPETLKAVDSYTIQTQLTFLYQNQPIQKDFPLHIKIIQELEDVLLEPQNPTEEQTLPLCLIEPLGIKIEKEIFSATKILLYQENKEELIRRYILGLPPSDDPDLSSIMPIPGLFEDDPIGSLAGSIIHKVLEQISVWLTQEEDQTKKLLQDIVECEIQSLHRTIPHALRKRIFEECFNIYKTKLIRNNFEALRQAKTEFQLTLPLGIHFLQGKIDLVLQKDDTIEIWDWKTNRVNESLRLQLLKKFEPQLKTYAYLIRLCHPELQQITTRLLFTRLAKPNIEDTEWTNTICWDTEELKKFEEETLELIDNINKFAYKI